MSDETRAEAPQVRAGQRIAKVIARAGICSRRDAEAWIAAGRVSVNGEVLTSPAFNVSDADDVRVDGKRLGAAERTRLFLFHKPRGLVTTARDPEGRPTVFDALPPGLPRLVAVGRLDVNTEGLLLLTNDGGLARVLELPSTGWLRRYRVRAHGSVDRAALERLSEGIQIDGVDYRGIEAALDREQGANVWITMGLREGKNREIKKVLEHLGLQVNRLIRVSFGPFELGDLAEGEAAEVRSRVLRDQLGVKLAREAGADFDAPLIVAEAPPPAEPSPKGPRSARGRRDLPSERSGAKGARRKPSFPARDEGDRAERRGPVKPSTPERRRKHVTRLRAEIAADAAATRTRIERSATQDRKGRTIAVERRSRAERAAAEQRPGPDRPSRGGREGPAGRERSRRERGSERPPGGKRHRDYEGRPHEGGKGQRRFEPAADRQRGGRKFDRPRGEARTGGGGNRPPRARSSAGRGPGTPGKGPPKGSGGGPRRPPRKP